LANTGQAAVRFHNTTAKEQQMVSHSMTQVGKWSRRLGGGALVLALAGLLAPATTSARIYEDETPEVIEVEGEAPWTPPNYDGQTGGGVPSIPSDSDGGGSESGGGLFDGGGYVPSGGGTVPRRPPPLTTLGEGPSLQTLKDLGFECNGGVGPVDLLVCHICGNTQAGTICICYDCQASSGKCTPFYDCT
jgi:hypothetical protein